MRTLGWHDLRGFLYNGTGRKVYPKDGTPFAEYIEAGGYRMPSRAWPYSHVKPLFTRKFANWLAENHPDFARKFDQEDAA